MDSYQPIKVHTSARNNSFLLICQNWSVAALQMILPGSLILYPESIFLSHPKLSYLAFLPNVKRLLQSHSLPHKRSALQLQNTHYVPYLVLLAHFPPGAVVMHHSFHTPLCESLPTWPLLPQKNATTKNACLVLSCHGLRQTCSIGTIGLAALCHHHNMTTACTAHGQALAQQGLMQRTASV